MYLFHFFQLCDIFICFFVTGSDSPPHKMSVRPILSHIKVTQIVLSENI